MIDNLIVNRVKKNECIDWLLHKHYAKSVLTII